MSWRNLSVISAVFVTVVFVGQGRAQDAIARAAYGKGVHAYYAGHVQEAGRFLNDAINAGSRDPRCYYFRGLTYLKSGQQYAAEGDFRLAATLEAQSQTKFDIGQALARVQGADRIKLEEIRREVRTTRTHPTRPSTDSPFANPAQPVQPLTQTDRPRKANRTVPRIDPNSLPADPTDPFRDDAAEPTVTEVVPLVDSIPSDSPTNIADDSTDFPDDFPMSPTNSDSDLGSAGGSASQGTSAAVRSLFRAFGGMIPRPATPANIPFPGNAGPGVPAELPNDGDSPFGDTPPVPTVDGTAADQPADEFPAEPDPPSEPDANESPANDKPSAEITDDDDSFNPFEDQ